LMSRIFSVSSSRFIVVSSTGQVGRHGPCNDYAGTG
jgi:hypothetical protein